MADNVIVSYNGNVLSPPPFVNRTANPLDYGTRWGYEDSIILKGQYYITGSGSITGIINPFSGQFSRFFVSGNSGQMFLDYPYTILEEISFDSNHFYPNTYVPYTIKLKNINVPSGIVDPSNEYSFTQNEDGTVSVNHRISARGIVTSASSDSALTNAKNFVKAFTGINPFSPCFIKTGSGILLSQSETLDRLNAVYSINEAYRYNTGESLPYVYMYSLDLDQSPDLDYINLNLNYSRQGSSINSNLSALRAGFASFNPYQFLQTNYGLSTGKYFLNSFGVSEDTGKNFIQYSCNIFSGAGDEFNGYFDYDIDLKWDKILDVKNFTINGKFVSKAPTSQKKIFLQNFKDGILLNSQSYNKYLRDLIMNSEIYSWTGQRPWPISKFSESLSINENSGLAEFSMSASFSDKDFIDYFNESSFSISVEGSRNLYEFKPSANIEGNYIIQDLQSLTRENIKISTSLKTTGNVSEGLSTIHSIQNNLSGAILNNNSIILEHSLNTGIFDTSADSSHLNSGSKFNLDPRHYYSQNAPSLRPPGYKYGL